MRHFRLLVSGAAPVEPLPPVRQSTPRGIQKSPAPSGALLVRSGYRVVKVLTTSQYERDYRSTMRQTRLPADLLPDSETQHREGADRAVERDAARIGARASEGEAELLDVLHRLGEAVIGRHGDGVALPLDPVRSRVGG